MPDLTLEEYGSKEQRLQSPLGQTAAGKAEIEGFQYGAAEKAERAGKPAKIVQLSEVKECEDHDRKFEGLHHSFPCCSRREGRAIRVLLECLCMLRRSPHEKEPVHAA